MMTENDVFNVINDCIFSFRDRRGVRLILEDLRIKCKITSRFRSYNVN